MRSRTSLFSAAVYRKNLIRFAPLWGVYLLLWLLMLPMAIVTQADAGRFLLGDLQYLVLTKALRIGALCAMLYAAAAAMVFFGWTFSARSVNTFAALPIRREAWCLTNLLSALTVSLAPNAVVAAATWAAAGAAGLPGLEVALQAFGLLSLEFLFFYGLAALCAAIVGQLAALPALYLLLNYGAVVLNDVIVTVLSTFVYGMRDSGYMALSRLSPAYYLMQRLDVVVRSEGDGAAYSCAFHGWHYLAALGLVGLVLLALSVLLFRGRRMETAGDVIAVRPLRRVLKYVFTTACSLVLGVLAAQSFFGGYNGPGLTAVVVCLLLGGFLGYFAAEILLKKTFRVFRREWIGFGAFAVCLLLALALMEFDAFGFERRVPELEQVESVTVSFTGASENAVVTDEAHISDLLTLHQSIIQNKAAQEDLAQMDPSADDTRDWSILRLVYQLKDGSTLLRRYTIYCTEAMWRDQASLPRQYAAILADPYMITLANTPDYDVDAAAISSCRIYFYNQEDDLWQEISLTDQEAFALYQDCVLPDMQEGLLRDTTPYYYDDTGDGCLATLYLEFSHEIPSPENPAVPMTLSWDYFDYTPRAGSRLAAAMEELTGVPLMTNAEYDALNSDKSDTPVG